MDFDLTGKVAVVTGGSRGLGQAMSIAFADHGATVVVASRKVEACEKLAASITERTRRPAFGVGCHVGVWADCDALVDTVYERLGRVDVLVNNAGMSPLYDSLADVTEEMFDKVIAVNYRGAFRLSALIGTRMAAGDGGSIINVSSIAAVQPSPIEIPYAGAKAALNNMTVGMARCFGPTVRVNMIMPGAFMTDITKAWDLDAFAESAKIRIPLQRGGQPEEVVGAALYLASDASSYTNGAIIKVDGGFAFSRGLTMHTFLIALSTFLASAVEMVEALTIVLAVGVTRGWRSALIGVAAGLASLTVIVAALGPALTVIPIDGLRLVIGGLLLTFGLQWLRKAILRASGLKPLHDEEAIFNKEVEDLRAAGSRQDVDWYSFTVAFKGVLLEGLEVAFIVVTFGGAQHAVGIAAAGAAAAAVTVAVVGLLVHAPLSRVPENSMKFVVGVMLTAFGTFWGGEGAGVHWPGSDAALVALIAFVALAAAGAVRVLRTPQPAPS